MVDLDIPQSDSPAGARLTGHFTSLFPNLLKFIIVIFISPKIVRREQIILLFGSFCILLISATVTWSSEVANVTVEGLSDDLYQNVTQHLTLFRQKDNDRLQVQRIKKLFSKGEDDIRAALAPFGYYNPVIKSNLEITETGFNAVYKVQTGPPVIVQNVFVKLDGEGKDNSTLTAGIKNFALKKGAILLQNRYENEKKKLINLAFREGYLDAVFTTHSIKINRDTNLSEIHLTLNTDKRYYFGETTSKQQIIKPQLLQSYFPYKKGAPYSPAKIFELQHILNRTSYFGEVLVQGKISAAVDREVPIHIELKPRQTLNEYSLGAGYATDTGIQARANWDNRLLNTRGHKIRAALLVAELERSGSIAYTVPLEDARHQNLLSRLSYQNKIWDDTDTTLFTAGLTRAYMGPKYNYDTSLVYRTEDYTIGSTSDDSFLLMPTINLGFAFANDLLKTKHGLKVSTGILGAIDGLGSDTDFLQLTLDGKFIFSPIQGFRIISRGSLGTTWVDSIDSIPPSLRFYAGGDSSIRGYKYKSIGSVDSSGTVVGGTHLVVGSIEVEKSISELWGLAAFWDVGSATDDLDLDFYQGAGAGLRVRLPFGQIRLDVASAITETDAPWRVHLTVGGDLL